MPGQKPDFKKIKEIEMPEDDLVGFWRTMIDILSIAFVTFHIYTGIFGLYPNIIQRSIHLMFGLTICLARIPIFRRRSWKSSIPFYDLLLIAIVISSCVYIITIYEEIMIDPMRNLSRIDSFLAIGLTVAILEGGRRSAGWIFVIMSILLMMYAYLGPYFPGIWRHKGFTIPTILQTLYHTTNGIWGILLHVSATILAIFSIFSAILLLTGGGETFIAIARIFTQKSTGGSAKVAIVASSFFGTVSGSAIANVVTTGSFTIPAMKASGYKPHFAAAVEAVASTGGQIVPPIMGAGAFVMAEILGISYLKIAAAAIIPAFLYYVCLYACVHFEAIKLNLTPVKEETESMLHIISFKRIIPLLLPVGTFLGILIKGYTIMTAGLWATLLSFSLYTVLNWQFLLANKEEFSRSLFKLCQIAADTIMRVVALLASAQIIIGLISLTGVGVKFSDMVVSLGGENLFLSLILVAVICLILGMGLPTTGAYVLAASILGPAVIRLGLPPLSAHLFIFYFSCLSTVTPPVCAASLMAAGLAKASWIRTALTGVNLAAAGFIVPFSFIYNPSMLLTNWSNIDTLLSIAIGILGVIGMASSIIGHLFSPIKRFAVRLIMAIAALMVFHPYAGAKLTGFIILGIIFVTNYRKSNSS